MTGTIGALIADGAAKLKAAGIESPMREARRMSAPRRMRPSGRAAWAPAKAGTASTAVKVKLAAIRRIYVSLCSLLTDAAKRRTDVSIAAIPLSRRSH